MVNVQVGEGREKRKQESLSEKPRKKGEKTREALHDMELSFSPKGTRDR